MSPGHLFGRLFYRAYSVKYVIFPRETSKIVGSSVIDFFVSQSVFVRNCADFNSRCLTFQLHM